MLPHLIGINGIYGDVIVTSDDPPVSEVEDVVYMPLGEGLWYDFDPRWGIYQSGNLVREAAYIRGPGENLVGQSLTQETPFAEEAPEDRYIYAGPINTHFGHFLLASLERFWHSDRSAKFLVHGPITPQEWFSNPVVAKVFRSLGISCEDVVRFEKPTRIRRLTIPGSSFYEARSVSQAYNRLCSAIGDKLLVSCDQNAGPPVYLSKQRLISGVWKIVNEETLADILERHGIEIVFPETLTLADQINLFRSRTVMSTTNSGLHTAVLNPGRSTVIGMTRDDAISSNFLLIDELKSNVSSYLAPYPPMDFLGATDSFLETCRMHRPDLIAESFLRLADV